MLKRMSIVWVIVIAVALTATWVITGTLIAQTTASVPKVQDKLAIGQDEVAQLLLLMDTDKNGKVSKQEYMRFMEQEFDRLDRDKSGELDPSELAQSQLRVSHYFTAVGK
jgi:Ca2+-binding EF-hand superfamily protein